MMPVEGADLSVYTIIRNKGLGLSNLRQNGKLVWSWKIFELTFVLMWLTAE
jgi:hypothetical protein